MQNDLDDLVVLLAELSGDPLEFVYFAFPWGEGELEGQDGPVDWQIDILTRLREGLLTVDQAIQLAVTSGHGIGKSALVAWIILWAISTFEDTKGVVTANTENQLKTKTWAELAKWFRLFIGKALFKMTATALYSADPEHEKTWRMDMVPWSERNTEAFAGLHNKGKRILVVMDEGSGIPDVIWEVTEGALTDTSTQIIFCAFGNPTRNKGRFRECFPGGKFAHRWQTIAVDSRSVPFTNKTQIQQWIDDYGLDSDFVRVRVLGKFPRTDAVSFIGLELAREAARRPLPDNPSWEPLVLGVDVGRFGDDPTVVYPRRGRDARSLPITVMRGWDLMRQAGEIVRLVNLYGASATFVDSGGVGGGLVDRLRQLGITVYEVDFGSKPDNLSENPSTRYFNKRAEIWGMLRDWLPRGCILEAIEGQDLDLVDELTGPAYSMSGEDMRIQLERKRDMRRRGVPSPNVADALACTFAFPVFVPQATADFGLPIASEPLVAADYNPFDQARMYN